MKLAITFYGFLRHYKTNFLLWQRLIEKYDADVFIHTWDTVQHKNDIVELPINHSGQDEKQTTQLDVNDVMSLYKPKYMMVEKYENYHDTFLQKVQPLEELRKEQIKNNPDDAHWANKGRYVSYASMYYSWWKVSQLKQRYEMENNIIYDNVLHTRIDFTLTDLLDINQNTFTLVTPPWPNGPAESWVNYNIGINDYWAYGPSKLLDIYCSIYPRLEKVWEFCMNADGYKFLEASNPHSIPVTNLAMSGVQNILKLNNQHGNILR